LTNMDQVKNKGSGGTEMCTQLRKDNLTYILKKPHQFGGVFYI